MARVVTTATRNKASAITPLNLSTVRPARQKTTLEREVESLREALDTHVGAVDADAAALSQATFYIDPVNGNDLRRGDTAASAIATWAEYSRRVGLKHVAVAQTVYLLGTINEDLVVNAIYESGLFIEGQREVLYSGTVSAATAWNTATSPVVAGSLADSSLPSNWTDSGPGSSSLLGKKFVMTSGAAVGLWGFILSDLGSKNARIPQLVNESFATGSPTMGDTFDVVELTRVNGQITVYGPIGLGVTLTDLEFVHTRPPLVGHAASVGLNGCILRQTDTHTESLVDSQGTIIGTLFATRFTGEGLSNFNFWGCSFRDCRMSFSNSVVGLGLINVHQAVTGGVQPQSAFLTMRTGSRVQVQFGSYGGIGIATANQSVVRIEPGGVLEVGSGGRVWGLGQTNGHGCFITSFGLACWPSGGSAPTFYEFDVSGSAVEFRLGGTNTDAATLASAGTIVAANNAAAIPLTS